MKTLTKTLALGAAALGILTAPAFAADATTTLAPPVFRCTSCGAQYQVKTKVMKDNTIQVKLEKLAISGNPKTR
jgi:hypothetical protein